MPTAPTRSERSALSLAEETLRLLRHAPAEAFAAYYLGTLPFLLGLLFFLTDMSRGARAPAHLLPASLALTGAYLWMKCWQCVFAQTLRRHFGLPDVPWSAGRVLRLILIQAACMPWSWLLQPLALAVTLPFGWAFAFFQNLTIFGDGREGLGRTLRRSRQQASLWPGQNHLLLLILGLLTAVLFANLVSAAVLLPKALHTLFGIETIFSRASFSYLNTTFLATMAALTFLVVDPLTKAFYARRCFHGEALRDGRDLLIDIRRLTAALVLAGMLCATFAPGRAMAAPAPTARSSVHGIDPGRLDRSLDRELKKLEYVWRQPRPPLPKKESAGFLAQLMKTFGSWLSRAGHRLAKGLAWLIDKLRGLFAHGKKAHTEGPAAFGWNYLLIYLVAAVGLSVIAIGLWRRRRGAGRSAQDRSETAVRRLPDLEAEEVAAEELPHESWFALGRELLAKGDCRLALRALFLGGLALLGSRGLLVLARSKSNREYLRELQRRAADRPELIGGFARGLELVERTWYGGHPVAPETVEGFLAEQQRLFRDVRS